MRRSPASLLAWALWTLCVAGLAASISLGRTWDVPDFNGGWVDGLVLFLAFGAYATVGAVVASKRPNNSFGWLFCGIGALVGIGAFSQVYGHYALVLEPGDARGGYLAAWITGWYWYPLIGGLSAFTLLLFPTGAPPSRRWRPLLWVLTAAGVVVTSGAALTERLRFGAYEVANPIGIDGLGSVEETTWGGVSLAVFILCILGALVSVVARFRASRGVERQQLKLFTFSAAVFATYSILGSLVPALEDFGGDVLFGVFISLVPISAGIAIMRYRLYDIDRLINRTLVYVTLTALLAGVYGLCVVVAPNVVGAERRSDLVVAASTLLVAALFHPVRGRVQGFIDRRFYRSRYDAARTIESLGTRLRDRVQLEEVKTDLLGAVSTTMQPSHASLWIRPEARR
ncbi:MAG TPA: hypothetical protein VE712_00445 [Actinomycetota bacterium]|nr:hypothetical protein [Actinomycetota bacterium]